MTTDAARLAGELEKWEQGDGPVAPDPVEWLRHAHPQEVMISAPRTTTLTNKRNGNGLYWDGVAGFVSGPGFMAWAKDFPEGTTLTVTATIGTP